MGADARPARFVLRPLSRRAVRVIRQRHRRSVCGLGAAGRGSCTCPSASISGPTWSAPAIGRRSASLTSRSISSAIGLALLPAYWVCWRQQRADEPSRTRGRPDLDPCLHRLVELSDRTRPEQHHGLRVMMPSPWFRRFAFAYGTASRSSTWSRSSSILRCSPSIPTIGVVLLGTHHSRDMSSSLRWGFLAPAMYWYGWTATAALGALIFGLVAALLPERWTRPFWSGWLWVVPAARDDRLRLPYAALVSTLARSADW